MQNPGFIQSHLEQVDEYGVYDFINDSNFNQFISFIRGESGEPFVNFTPNYDGEHMFGSDTLLVPTPVALEEVFNFNSSTSTSEHNSLPNSLPPFGKDMEIENGDNNEKDEDDNSSDNINSTLTTTNPTGNRARTLGSERKRRSRMKEKLYALRSLVPNITKMDKASIIRDAVAYVQNLQMQAETIKAEITRLEASSSAPGKFPDLKENQKEPNNVIPEHMHLHSRQVLQMDVFQVEDKEFYMRVICNKSEGVAVALHKTLESLSPFEIKNSNFSTASGRYVLTFTVDVKEFKEQMNAPNLKLWVTRALLNQGFQTKTL